MRSPWIIVWALGAVACACAPKAEHSPSPAGGDAVVEAPYGSWASPITAEVVMQEGVGLGQPAIDGEAVYWLERRPSGRAALVVREPGGDVRDALPDDFEVRSRVHGYGGGAFTVHEGTIYFVNGSDQRVYRRLPGQSPSPVTPQGDHRYADLTVEPVTGRIVAVREDHGAEPEPRSEIVILDPDAPGPGQVIATGDDFYAAPRPSPDGDELAYLAWNHPHMPWQATELRVVALEAGASPRHVAGGPRESIFQPAWSPGGELHFVSDRTGWWNLYRAVDDGVEPVVQMEAEMGLPHWRFGAATYGFAADGRLVFTFKQGGRWQLAVAPPGGAWSPVDLPHAQIHLLRVAGDQAVFVGGMPTAPSEVVALALDDGSWASLRQAREVRVDPAYLSQPEPVTFPTADGAVAHGYHYPPRNPHFRGPEGEAPPLLVYNHGGPTSATRTTLRFGLQYWTSRGFAVLDVDYRGSTGYGRAYREALDGAWGVADVQDCVHGARHLVERGLVDPDRVVAKGGSAGGYTTLQALVTTDFFTAGVSYFGLTDLVAMAEDTHKFESRYLDSLVGPYPEAVDVYRERSPLHHVERLSVPMALFHGAQDRVVPPEQSQRMADSLRERGLPVAHVVFDDEGHGFRQAENVQRTLEGELYFYGRIFGFEPADDVEPIPIDNL